MVTDSEKASSEIVDSIAEQPIAHRHLRFWWILGGSFVCQCLVLQFYNWFPRLHELALPESTLGTLLISLLWGTLASVYALIAFCAVWGSINFQLRLLLTFGLAVVFAIVTPFDSQSPVPKWTIIIIFQLLLGCYVVLLIATAWLTKLSLHDSRETHALRKTAKTFSLKYMGAWGIAFAVLLTISRALIGNQTFDDLFPDQAMAIEVVIVFSALFTANFLLAIPLTLSILSNGCWWLRVLGCVFAVVPITKLENYILNQISGGETPLTLMFGMNLVQLIWVILTFGLLRRTGFRLVVAQSRA